MRPAAEQDLVSRVRLLSNWGKIRRLVTSIPELSILIALIVGGYLVMVVFSKVEGTEVLSSSSILLVIVGSFLISTAIAMIAVIGGIGGGVIFTPIMLGFTSIDTLIIRATGLVVAMFSGLISSGPFMRTGIANIRIVLYCAVTIVIGSLAGSTTAVYLRSIMGDTGDAVVRLSLGLLMIFIAYFFIAGGALSEYPEVKNIDPTSKKLGLKGTYWEESLNRLVSYQTTRSIQGGLIFILLGFIGGFFGLGGGAFLTATLNLVMGAPIKVAAANSGVLLSMGNATAIWTYITYGSLIAIFVAPWLLGQVVGGILGAHLLIRVRASFIRYVLIAILLVSSVKLLIRGLEVLFGIDIPVL